MRLRRIVVSSICSIVAPFVGAANAQTPVIECPTSGGGGDLWWRGFYVETYPADSIDRVELLLAAQSPQQWVVQLIVRQDTYDGPQVALDEIQIDEEDWVLPEDPVAGDGFGSDLEDAFPFGGADYRYEATFELGGAEVAAGRTLTFDLQIVGGSGGNSLFYDVGRCGLGDDTCDLCGFQITETTGKEPPLDTFRRASVGTRIFAGESAVPGLQTAGAVALVLITMALGVGRLRRKR